MSSFAERLPKRNFETRKGRLCSIALLTSIMCLGACPVQTQTASEKKLAKKYFAEGEKLFARGEYNSAAAAFVKAYQVLPHSTVLANAALSYDKAGEIILALRAYNKYLEDNDDSAIRKRKAELESYVGKLRITCSVDPCVVSVDQTQKNDAEPIVYVFPGHHWIEASADGYTDATVEVVAHAGELSEIGLTFQKLQPVPKKVIPKPIKKVPTPVPVPAEEDDSSSPLGAPFWVSTSVAVVAGAGTVFFGVRTLKDKQKFDQSGQTDQSLAESGKKNRLATNILLSATAAAVATAAGFMIYDLRFKKRSAKVAVAPGLGLGALVTVDF